MRKRRWLGILIGIIFILAANGFGAGKLTRPEVAGSISGIKGTVRVNHLPILPNEAIFTSDIISTGDTSGAFLNLRGTVAILVANSEMSLSGSGESPALTLTKGALEIRSGKSQPALVFVPGGSVVVKSDGDFPSICRIASVGRSAFVIADRGHVEIHGSGAPTLLAPGKSIHMEAGMPQAGGGAQVAGKVAVAIPKEVVERGGKGAKIPLSTSDTVNWMDVVQTLGNGRTRIALLDGSFLNIGARSIMQIVRHDAATQQTEVELTLGHMRGEVVKLTRSGAKFETRTPTAVIGVVGTVFMVQATPTLTRVWSVQDDVTVRNINPNVVGTVTLHTGQFTTVHFGLPPGAPTQVSVDQMQDEVKNTDAGPRAPGVTAAVSQAGTGGQVGQTGTLANIASSGGTGVVNVAVAGTSAGLGAVAIQRVTTASSNNQATDTTLSAAAAADSQAATSSNSALTAANSAQSATQQAASISQTTATTVNNVIQGCGCVSPSVP